MKYDEQALHAGLRRSIKAMTPEMDESLLTQPVEIADGSEWYLEGLPTRRKGAVRALMAAAACLVLILAGMFWQGGRVVTDVYLDVNPSVAMHLNHSERVVRTEALNADGEQVLSSLQLRGKRAEDALEDLLDEMEAQGFLRRDRNGVLVTVASQDEETENRLLEALRQRAQKRVGTSTVLTQQLTVDDDLLEEAQKNQVSPGRAELLNAVSARTGIPTARLSRLSIDDLLDLLDDDDDDDWDEDDHDDDDHDDDRDGDDDWDDDDWDDNDWDDDDHAYESAPQGQNSGGSQTTQRHDDNDDDDDDWDDDDDDDD